MGSVLHEIGKLQLLCKEQAERIKELEAEVKGLEKLKKAVFQYENDGDLLKFTEEIDLLKGGKDAKLR